MRSRRLLLTVLLAAGLGLAACGSDTDGELVEPGDDDPVVQTSTTTGDASPAGGGAAAGMANPASVHCVEKGGTEVAYENADGEFGICEFSDGTECEAFTFFRGECKPGQHQEAPERAGATRKS